jgi:hypothetical protein
MSAFMENLAELLAAVESRSHFELDLYPQGVERTLHFSFAGDVVSVRCSSRTSWQPSVPVEVMDFAEFRAMCTDLAKDFSRAVSLIGSQIADLAPFCHWRHGDFSG